MKGVPLRVEMGPRDLEKGECVVVSRENRESGFIKASWCGELACEEALKEQAGVTSRCMPFDQSECGEKCVVCGKPAKKLVYWGKAY